MTEVPSVVSASLLTGAERERDGSSRGGEKTMREEAERNGEMRKKSNGGGGEQCTEARRKSDLREKTTIDKDSK